MGDNGFYRARIGPDPCTGLGSPIGTKLAELFVQPVMLAGRGVIQPVPAGWSGKMVYDYVNGTLVKTSKLQPA